MLKARSFEVLNTDLEAPTGAIDLSDKSTIQGLCERAGRGEFVGGCLAPPCGKRSRTRNSRPNPPVVAARSHPYGWAGQSMTEAIQLSLSSDLFFSTLEVLCALHRGGAWSALEQPEDLGDSASVLALDITSRAILEVGARCVSFDQGPWGAASTKPTTVAGTLYGLEYLSVRSEKKQLGPPGGDAGDLIVNHDSAHYPGGLNGIICDLAIMDLVDKGRARPAPDAVFWKDYDGNNVHSAIRADASEQWCAKYVGASSAPIVVHEGVKHRPFADGGGLCSPGRWFPEARGAPKLERVKQVFDEIVENL